jgi:phage shock protein A
MEQFGKQNEDIFEHTKNIGIEKDSAGDIFEGALEEKYNDLAKQVERLGNTFNSLQRRFKIAQQNKDIKEAFGDIKSKDYELAVERMSSMVTMMEKNLDQMQEINDQMDNLFEYKKEIIDRPEFDNLRDFNQN